MELTDFSDLRPPDEGPVVIPLNGKRYKADAQPPAQVVLSATTGVDSEALDAMAKMADGGALTTREEAAAARAGESSLLKAVRFLDTVLEPEAREQWGYFMSAVPDDADARTKATHTRHKITLRQVVAVFRALVQHYSGGRPTTPASSSENGHGDAGTTSTAGAQPAEG